MRTVTTCCLLLAAVTAVASTSSVTATVANFARRQHRADEPAKMPAIMAADIGASSGSPELMYIERNFTAQRVLHVPTCIRAEVGILAVAGKIEPMRVLIAYSGIGAVAAGLCVQALLNEVNIEYILWPGTAGMSAVIGGPFAAPMPAGACTLNTQARMLSLGSTCVTSKSANIMCGMCRGLQTSTFPIADECSRMRCSGQNNTMGHCLYSLNTTVADKVKASLATFTPAPMPADLQALAGEWWNATRPSSAATPVQPTIFDDCATTTTSNLIDPSIPIDAWCRDAVSSLVKKPADQVPCVADMEDSGITQVLSEMAPDVPVAIIRGASNYGNSPLVQGTVAGYGTYWAQNFTWTSPEKLGAMNKGGYSYAVRVTNDIVLHFLASL